MTDPTLTEQSLNQSEVASAGLVDGSSDAAPVTGDGGNRTGGVDVVLPKSLGNIGSALTIDLQSEAGQVFSVTANTALGTINFANVQPGAQWTVLHSQDATGGRRTQFSGVTWLAGAGSVTPGANALDAFSFVSPDGVNVYGFQSTSPVYSQAMQGQARNVFETLPRLIGLQGAMALSSAFTNFTHFTPDYDLTFGNIETACTGTLASGLTFAKMAVLQYNGGNSYTTVARIASDTTLWNAQGYHNRAIVDDGQGHSISTATLKAGLTYAAGVLAIGTTMPQLAGQQLHNAALGLADSTGKLPRLSGTTSGSQTDINASYSGISGGLGAYFWFALS